MESFLNYRHLLPSSSQQAKLPNSSDLINNENGQTMIEFILLFVIIVMISMTFLTSINSNIADYWLGMVMIIVDDPSVVIQI